MSLGLTCLFLLHPPHLALASSLTSFRYTFSVKSSPLTTLSRVYLPLALYIPLKVEAGVTTPRFFQASAPT